MLMREVAIKHGMESAKNVLRPFSRVMLKLISTGNQLSPDMINKDGFADWGPNISKVDAPLKLLRKAIPMPTLNTTETAWEVNLKTSVELYTIWEETGVLEQLEDIDENLFDVITDIMDEKREELERVPRGTGGGLNHDDRHQAPRPGRALHGPRRGVARGEPEPDGRPRGHRLGRADHRQALDADPEGPRRGRARPDVAAGEGRRDRRPPRPRRAPAGDGEDAVRLGQEDPDARASGTTSPAASAATSRATRPRCCG